MPQCQTCGTINREGMNRCGVCGATIIPGQEYQREKLTPLKAPSPERTLVSRALFGLAGSILLISAGVYSFITASTIGFFLGLVLLVIGIVMTRSAFRYLSEIRYLRQIPLGDSDGDRSRPAFIGGTSPLPSFIQEVDRIERDVEEQQRRA